MTRKRLDAYMTKAAIMLPLFRYVNIDGKVLEPCAGEGAMVTTLNLHPFITSVIASDIDPEYGWDHTEDAAHPDTWYYRKDTGISWLITNPPFNQAAEILDVAWNAGIPNIAMLLRLSFLEPTTGRGSFRGRKRLLAKLNSHLSYLIPFGSTRPSFTGDGNTDSVTTAWFCWQQSNRGKGTKVICVPNWQVDDVNRQNVVDAALPF